MREGEENIKTPKHPNIFSIARVLLFTHHIPDWSSPATQKWVWSLICRFFVAVQSIGFEIEPRSTIFGILLSCFQLSQWNIAPWTQVWHQVLERMFELFESCLPISEVQHRSISVLTIFNPVRNITVRRPKKSCRSMLSDRQGNRGSFLLFYSRFGILCSEKAWKVFTSSGKSRWHITGS